MKGIVVKIFFPSSLNFFRLFTQTFLTKNLTWSFHQEGLSGHFVETASSLWTSSMQAVSHVKSQQHT